MARRLLTKQLRVQVLARDGYACRMCGRSPPQVTLEIDHIIPVSAGGADTLDNLGALCRDCNSGKSDLIIPYKETSLVPKDLERHFKLIRDPVTGDYLRWHLYCYFKVENHAGAEVDSYHREWNISRTRVAESSDPNGLARRRIEEETAAFVEQIREALAASGHRLVVTEEGLVRLAQGVHES